MSVSPRRDVVHPGGARRPRHVARRGRRAVSRGPPPRTPAGGVRPSRPAGPRRRRRPGGGSLQQPWWRRWRGTPVAASSCRRRSSGWPGHVTSGSWSAALITMRARRDRRPRHGTDRGVRLAAGRGHGRDHDLAGLHRRRPRACTEHGACRHGVLDPPRSAACDRRLDRGCPGRADHRHDRAAHRREQPDAARSVSPWPPTCPWSSGRRGRRETCPSARPSWR